jgi:hypothetical protein
MGNAQSARKFTQEEIDQRRTELALDDSLKSYVPITEGPFTCEITPHSNGDANADGNSNDQLINSIDMCVSQLEARVATLEQTVATNSMK